MHLSLVDRRAGFRAQVSDREIESRAAFGSPTVPERDCHLKPKGRHYYSTVTSVFLSPRSV
jgi:hypothetical protein